MGNRSTTATSRGPRNRTSAPVPESRLVRTAAYYKLFTTTIFVLLGTIIIARSLSEGGAPAPTLIGACLVGLGVARWVAIYRNRTR